LPDILGVESLIVDLMPVENQKRIAIVHDALCVSGGAERLVLWMSEVFPEAPIYTSVYLPDQTFPEFKQKHVIALPFSRFIRTERQFKLLFPLWLIEFQLMKFREYDVVLTSSTYLAKYIKPANKGSHRAYINAPFRFLWKPESYSDESLPTNKPLTALIKVFLPALRAWDFKATQKIPFIAANCENMGREIERVYRRKPSVITAPIRIDDYPLSDGRGEYFITVSRLISHKRIDLAIEACNRLKLPLMVVGDGPEREKLEEMAGDTIRFTGSVSDLELKRLYQGAKALLFPSHEDFGIVPLEAQACGIPVIAFGRGGVLETVLEGKTGFFFQEQTADSLCNAMVKMSDGNFSPVEIRKWVSRFDFSSFKSKLIQFVNEGCE